MDKADRMIKRHGRTSHDYQEHRNRHLRMPPMDIVVQATTYSWTVSLDV